MTMFTMQSEDLLAALKLLGEILTACASAYAAYCSRRAAKQSRTNNGVVNDILLIVAQELQKRIDEPIEPDEDKESTDV